jgi:hypothetical protein
MLPGGIIVQRGTHRVHDSPFGMRLRTAFIAVLIAGCAAPLLPGQSREGEVIARYGPPTDEWRLPDGTRMLMYADTPLGYGSTRIAIDRDSIVRSVEPVINEEHFARLLPGMSMQDVAHELGRPGGFGRYPLLDEDVWSWRYIEFGNRRMFFNAHFDPAGRLKYTSRTPEPPKPRR